MTVWQAILVGLIQGLTEFLPVSSSGHIRLIERIMGIKGELSFALILHVATLFAVVFAMRKEVLDFVRSPKKWGYVIVATLCSLLVVFALSGLLKSALSGKYLAPSFLVTAALLLISGLVKPKKTAITYFDAAIIGCVQGLAVLPGLSRSGSTVSTAMMLGNERAQSVSLSFLLSIPIIIGSTAIDLITNGIGTIRPLPLVCGFLAAFISGTVAVKLMLRLSAKAWDWFVVYLTALSVFLIANDLFFNLF